MENEDKKELRSSDWIGRTGKDGFVYRAWMKNQGILQYEFNNKPVIGIFNTWSKLMPCNGHFRELAASVKKRIWERIWIFYGENRGARLLGIPINRTPIYYGF